MLNNRDTAYLCRSLALLLHSGVTPAQGCRLLDREGAAVPKQLTDALDRGLPLSEAMEMTGVFPPVVPALVRVGEETGNLEAALSALADQFDYRRRTEEQLRQALIYPCLILLLMLAVLTVLLVQVLPVFQRVYASLGGGLTGPGAWLLELGKGLKTVLPALGLVVLVIGAAGVSLFRHPQIGKSLLAPLADRGILRRFRNARFVQGLAMGIRSGLTAEASAELAGLLLEDSPKAAARHRRLQEALSAGTAPAQALEENGFLSPAQSRLLAVGLHSGSGESILALLVQQLEEEACRALEAAAGRIEPALVLITSGLVGIILLTVMLPLLNILSLIG